MKTKQIISIIIVLLLGVFIGKLVFKNGSSLKETNTEVVEVKHWTCSMHPEIDLPKFGPCPKCGMDLIPATTSNDGLAANQFKMTENAMALANIETMVVGGDTSDNLQKGSFLKLSGKVEANRKSSAMQTAHFGGRLERLYFKTEGEEVKQGNLIATVYSPELVTAQNELLEAMKIKELQPELYKAVRNKLKLWKISENQILQIENNKKVITNFNMYANVSGTIDKILTQEGNHIKEGAPLFMISNLSTVWAVFDVYEQDVKHLKNNQNVSINFIAYPDKEVTAKIDFIDPVLNSKTRTVSARATLKNTSNELKPGMLISSFVNLNGKEIKTTNIVEVPKTAVLWTGKRSIVYVKPNKNESIFELREVELGESLGDQYLILSGLSNDEIVVKNGAFTVDAVAQLKGKNSMMNSNFEKENSKSSKLKVSDQFKKQILSTFQAYIQLKDAYVMTDAKKVATEASKTLSILNKVQMIHLKTPISHEKWMKSAKELKMSLESIQREKGIESQRKTFIVLSNTMQDIVETFELNSKIYVQYCPMANDNTGAFWLSANKKIMNPYFGDVMLNCGSVEKVIE